MVKCEKIITQSPIISIEKIETAEGDFLLDKNYISNVIFEVCEDCYKMPSLPQGAFAVRKVKEMQQHVAVCKNESHDEKPGRFDLKQHFSKLSPVKYNEKMMNSIWGRYNRNSPHNFKKNNAADGTEGGLQQPNAVAHEFPVTTKNIANGQQGYFLSTADLMHHQGHLLSQEVVGNHHRYEEIWNFSDI